MTDPRREAAREVLQDLYAQIPTMHCKGLCWDSCTAIDVSEIEREPLRERGIELSDRPSVERTREARETGVPIRCPALSALNTCSVYDVRPFICRVFGAAADSACEHGCYPEGGKYTTGAKVRDIVQRIEVLSRAVTGTARIPLLPEYQHLSPHDDA